MGFIIINHFRIQIKGAAKQPAPKLQAKASPKEVRRQPERQHLIRISSNSAYLGIETCCQETIDRYISCTEVLQTCDFKW